MQHLDEGTIHAWLDGALSPNEASAAAAHVQACEQCAGAVAEARGLIAASSRILGALDDVPAVPDMRGAATALRARRRGAWWRRSGVGYAAAAVVLLAAGTTIVMRSAGSDAAFEAAPLTVRQDTAAASQPGDVPERSAPAPEGKTVDEMAGSARSAASGTSTSAREKDAAKEELAVDRIVPLPGAMPRPAAAPPNVKAEARKALADAAAPARGAVLQGHVLDAATGAPVAGATVSVDTARVATRTDSAGKFQLEQVPLGTQTVSVRAFGFQQAQHQMAVQARDSVQLGFALQKMASAAEQVVQGERRQRAIERAAPVMNVDSQRRADANVLGCYDLRPADDASKLADRVLPASLPQRVQLDAGGDVARRAEGAANRARTISGPGVAESWRLVGDSLELTWIHNATRHTLRFARHDGRWIAPGVLLQPCG